MVKKELFGKTSDGKEVFLFTLTGDNIKAEIINFGGIIKSIYVPDKNGVLTDVCLGFDNVADYENDNKYFGATVGRNANRIKDGIIKIDDEIYRLERNANGHNLHGGKSGFHKKLWNYSINEDKLILSLESPHLEGNFPGNLTAGVIFELENDALKITYNAVSDKDTICNLTNHSYFNLTGHFSGSIKNHKLKINALYYTPLDSDSVPNGEILKVENTKYDYTDLKYIEDDLDINFVINDNCRLKRAAVLLSENSGIKMEVLTTKPGIQIYTGNFLSNVSGKGNSIYNKNGGICLETQYFPNNTNFSHFPSSVLRANQEYKHETIYSFELV